MLVYLSGTLSLEMAMGSLHVLFLSQRVTSAKTESSFSLLRWPNTVFARALPNAIQRAHKDGKKQTCRRYGDHFIFSMPAQSVLFFFIIERSVLRVLVFYYKGLLEKVTMQRTQQFSAFSLLPEESS